MATRLIAVSGAGIGKAYQRKVGTPTPPWPPPGWTEPGFDDSDWDAPIHLEDYFAGRGLPYPPTDPSGELTYLPYGFNRRWISDPARWVTPQVEYDTTGVPVDREKLYRYAFEVEEPGVLTVEWCAYHRCLTGLWVNGVQVRKGSREVDNAPAGLWFVSPAGRPGPLLACAPAVVGTNLVAISAFEGGNTWAACYRISFLSSVQGESPVTCTLRPVGGDPDGESWNLLGTTKFMRRGVELTSSPLADPERAEHALCVNGWRQGAPFAGPADDDKFLWHVPMGTVAVPEDPTGESDYTPNPDFEQSWDHLLGGDHHTRFNWQSIDARVMDSTATLVLKIRARTELPSPGVLLDELLVTYATQWDTGAQPQDTTVDGPPLWPVDAINPLVLTDTYTDYTIPVPLEPLSGTPWTPEQLFRMKWGLRANAFAEHMSGTLRISSFLIEATWRRAPAPAPAASGWNDARPYRMGHLLLDSFGHYQTADLGGSEQLHSSGVRAFAGTNDAMFDDAYPPGQNVATGTPVSLGDVAPSYKWPSAYGTVAIERPGRGGRDGCLRLTGNASAVSRFEQRMTGQTFASGARIGFAFKMTAPGGWPSASLYVRVLTLSTLASVARTPWPRPAVTLDVRADGRLVVNRSGGPWPNLAGAHLVSTVAIGDLAAWHYLELNVNPQPANRVTPAPTDASPNGFVQLRIDGADAGNWANVEAVLDFWGSSTDGVHAPGTGRQMGDATPATDRAPAADYLVLGGDPHYPTEAHTLDRWYDDLYVAAPRPASDAAMSQSIPLQFHGDAVVGVLYPTGAPGPTYAVPHLATTVGASPPAAIADAPFHDADASFVQDLTAAPAPAQEPLSLVWPPVESTGAVAGEATGIVAYQYVGVTTRREAWDGPEIESRWLAPYVTDTDLASPLAVAGFLWDEAAPHRYTIMPMGFRYGYCTSHNPFPLGLDGLSPPHSGLTPEEFNATDRGLALLVQPDAQATSRLTQVLIEVLGAVPAPLAVARGRTWVIWWP